MISATSLKLLLLFGMLAYRDIDLSMYSDLPEAYRSLLGIGDDVDVGAWPSSMFSDRSAASWWLWRRW